MYYIRSNTFWRNSYYFGGQKSNFSPLNIFLNIEIVQFENIVEVSILPGHKRGGGGGEK